jgi:hypothetical protein
VTDAAMSVAELLPVAGRAERLRERLMELRTDMLGRMLRRGQVEPGHLPLIVGINAALDALADAEPEKAAARAVVSDDGQDIRLTLYREAGAVTAVELLLCSAPDGVLVRAAPMGRACCCCRRPYCRSHQEGDPAACTFLPGGISSVPVSEHQDAAFIASADSADEAAELLDDFLIALLELPGDAWPDLMVALPDELFNRIDRHIEALRVARSLSVLPLEYLISTRG